MTDLQSGVVPRIFLVTKLCKIRTAGRARIYQDPIIKRWKTGFMVPQTGNKQKTNLVGRLSVNYEQRRTKAGLKSCLLLPCEMCSDLAISLFNISP